MGTLLSLICVGSIVSIWYFWRKKPDKKYLIISVVALITSSFLYSLTPEYKKDLAKKEAESSSKAISKKIASESVSRAESSKKQQSVVKDTKKETDKKVSSATKTVAKSSTSKSKASAKKVSAKELLRRAKKLKYGMSYDEVKKIMPELSNQVRKNYLLIRNILYEYF